MIHFLATKLKKFAWEIETQMSCEEFDNWVLFYKEKHRQERMAQKRAQAQNRTRGR